MLRTILKSVVLVLAIEAGGALWGAEATIATGAASPEVQPKASEPLAGSPLAATAPVPTAWQTDYFAAYSLAREQKKLLLVYFAAPSGDANCERFEREALADAANVARMREYIAVRLTTASTIRVGEAETRLLDHSSFAEMLGQSGVVVVDLAHVDTPSYGQVVSVLPFSFAFHATKEGLAALLTLPPGTLTQRTLTYAVRVYSDRAQSADGQYSTMLMEEAERAAAHQAAIHRQGHHNWESRFHSITARLGGGLMAQEVAAESWPGQRMVESAYELVHSWRQSPGHWRAVSSPQPLFGYDMQYASNGIWYGVGLFGNRG